MNLKEAIIFAQTELKAKGIASATLDAEVLLLEALDKTHKEENRDKGWMYLNFGKYVLFPEEEIKFKNFIGRRKKHEPVAYIINRKEFYGLDFYVNENVLIPRAETEIIVDEALAALENSETGFTLIDIGTGSGCIPISILKASHANNIKIRKVYANDISPKALEVARTNAKRHKVSSGIAFLECDLVIALDRIKTDKNIVLTANLPYVSPADYEKLSPNVKNFEPKIALTAKNEGLYHITRLIEKFAAISANMSSYYLFLEADPGQMKAIESLARKNLPNALVEIIKDLRGKKRIAKIYKG